MIKTGTTSYLCKVPFPQNWALKKWACVKHSQIGYHDVVLVTSSQVLTALPFCIGFLGAYFVSLLNTFFLALLHTLNVVDFCWFKVTWYPFTVE
jgi:hypothetical protein